MEVTNQMLVDATEAAQCTAADHSARPARCQAHENPDYRELAGRVARTIKKVRAPEVEL
jgi:hypothetical protein